ncbi:related to LisH motif-containing protein [Rhynchosporium agropyri]|uniref:Related to LisH motif-containing protein n=3 Tax=Rhynchosporium TaxID=38037 RepID=A0A1E1MRZ1_RHYSE|nr:related to LisH motif-containing protein [Rhynchosporium commune]CZT07338.1 related to LisH motif-containing protein [Rhynchosporium agropyri]CZT51545.1 related to LisH motif-containing protein [Rhynchosporium secalis]
MMTIINWESLLKITDINALIFDYLITEGYPSAAAKFSKEANLRLPHAEESLRARRQIQHSIQSGNIKEAVEALNELEPQVLDSNPSLHFALLRLQLVELIRVCNATPGGKGDLTPALTFASTHLAPRAPTNNEFMEDLERTMALLVFPADSLEPPLAALLRPELRRTVADRVNKAILTAQNARRDASIRGLVRLRAWAEDTARLSKKDLPSHIGLGLDGDERGSSTGNAHEPMVS